MVIDVYVSLPPRVLPNFVVWGQELGTAPRQMGRMPPETKHLLTTINELYIVRTATKHAIHRHPQTEQILRSITQAGKRIKT